MKTLGRLVRLSLGPSAAADAACGVVLGAGLWPGGLAPWLQVLGALGVYHGGMALNDWADRHEDARVRPDRPIPSGGISAGGALVLALALLLGGVACSLAADLRAGLVLAAVAVCAVVYDVAGRGAWRGPALLALCRAGNLGAAGWLGARLVGVEPIHVLAPAALYGAYVFVVARLGRMEDAEDAAELGRRPAALLFAASSLLLAAAFVPFGTGLPRVVARVAVAGLAVGTLLVGARVSEPWTRGRVMASMGLALRRLLLFPVLFAASVPSTSALVVAGLAILGWPLSARLRRVFPPS